MADANTGKMTPQPEDMSSNIRKSRTEITYDLLRVTPAFQRKVNKRSDRLTNVMFVMLIFSIGVWFRFYVHDLFIENYGEINFNLRVVESDPLGFGAYLGATAGEVLLTNAYADFFSYYIPYVDEFSVGWNPYTGSDEPGTRLNGYVYGPYYIVSISLGKMWFNLDTIESIVYSNILLDSATYVMVYLLAQRVTGNVIALILALVGSFSPISLFFIAYAGLNAPIMNLTFLLFVYFYVEKRDHLSMFFLALSILTKQFPLFFAMPMGYWMVRRYGFAKGVAYYLEGVAYFFVLSIPYILTTPLLYIRKLILPSSGSSSMYCPAVGEATNLFHSFIPSDVCDPQRVGSSYPINPDLLPPYVVDLFGMVNEHLLFSICIILVGWLALTAYDYFEENEKLYYVYISAYFFIAHATIARGIFKYYLHFLVPLLILSIIPGNSSKSLNLRLGYLLNRGYQTWWDPKYRSTQVTTSYWILGISLFVTVSAIFLVIDMFISLIVPYLGTKALWYLILSPIVFFTILRPNYVDRDEHSNMNSQETNTTYSSYIPIILFYTGLACLGGLLLSRLASLYFVEISRFNGYLLIGAVLGLNIVLLPIILSVVRKEQLKNKFMNFDMTQFLLDIVVLVIAFLIINQFQIDVFNSPRYSIALVILIYSFIPMGLLGGQVWASVIRMPLNVIRQVLTLFRNYSLSPSPRL